MTAFEVYLITQLDTAAALLALLVIPWVFVTAHVEAGRAENNLNPRIGRILGPALGLILLSMAIPSKEDAAMMYVIPAISKNEQLSKLPASIVELADKKIQAMIKEVGK